MVVDGKNEESGISWDGEECVHDVGCEAGRR